MQSNTTSSSLNSSYDSGIDSLCSEFEKLEVPSRIENFKIHLSSNKYLDVFTLHEETNQVRTGRVYKLCMSTM